MPDSREFDVRQLPTLALPYDVATKELQDTPRIVGGANTYITAGGKLALAPGLNNTGLSAYSLAQRIDRIVSYETIESSPRVYLLASAYTGAVWTLYYICLDDVTPIWTSLGSYRGIDNSLDPHQFTVANGVVYIKSFNATFAANKGIGAVIFDATGGVVTVRPWGVFNISPGPAHLGNFGGGTASTKIGYRYAYAYVTSTGQISSRSAASVSTGPLLNNKPRIQVPYNTDSNVTKVNIYRTSDGGGTFYFLYQELNNSAGGSFDFDDDNSALVAGNPTYDSELDTRNIAPSEVSNMPPPMNRSLTAALSGTFDAVVGMEYFARRHWYGLGNRLYFSGQEEIFNGVPEESFPNPWGTKGNYYILRGQIRQIKATKRALYINTSTEVHILVGQDTTNFLFDTVVSDIAAPYILSPGTAGAAIVAFRDTVFFLSSDLQVYKLTGANSPELISAPLGSSLRDLIAPLGAANRARVTFEIFSRDGNSWLIVNVADVLDPTANRQFVYDLMRDVWFTPWAKKINSMVFGRLKKGDQNKHLICVTWDGSTSRLSVLDLASVSDHGTNFTPSVVFNLSTIPAGNHINDLRRPAHVPMLAYFITERTKFAGDTDPYVTYRTDEFAGSLASVAGLDPPFLAQHTSYSEKWYPIQQAVKRVQISVTGIPGERFELQNIAFVFQPEAGV